MPAEAARKKFIDSFRRRWTSGLSERCSHLLIRGFHD
jgi:hypothetical protein